MSSTAVIIPNLHSRHLGTILNALEQQTIAPDEVLVVGQDRFCFTSSNPRVRFLHTPQPVVPALARNLGIAYTAGEICCFLDADCIPAPTWLEELLAALDMGYVAVGGAIAVGRNTGETFWQRCDNIAAMGYFLETAPAGPRPFLITANIAIRRAALRQVGSFDQRFRFAASEDTDLSFRLRQAGHTLYFTPHARVVHLTGRTTAAAVWQHIRLYGYQWIPLQQQYRAQLRPAHWQMLARRAPPLAWLLLPLLTLRDTWGLWRGQPALLRRYWPLLPIIYWARTAWYWGQLDYVRQEAQP